MLSDVSESVKASGEATVPSVLVKPVNQTSVSSGDEKAGDVSSVKQKFSLRPPPVRASQSAKPVFLPASTSALSTKPLSLPAIKARLSLGRRLPSET
ncbi:hypothetical protein HID58_088903 [Brassica napus]|uniref:Uncharacterized protein n=1 Tax=Brassica napus TaxID=3708 RepID=A0ABQ7XXH1_BRANA|nr:hypothetical protein HID58_088903 [Brassica napus]